MTNAWSVILAGLVAVAAARFLGPETLELGVADQNEILQRVRTASGARYVGDTIEFWNKGDEALLTVDGEPFSCVVSDPTAP